MKQSATYICGLMAVAILWAAAGSGEAQAQTRAQGQTPTPTPDQLRMLRQLPEGQREELMRSLGIGMTDPELGTEFDLDFPTLLRPRRAEPEDDGIPRLTAESTIILRLQLPRIDEEDPFERRATQQQRADQLLVPPPPEPRTPDRRQRLPPSVIEDPGVYLEQDSPGRVDPLMEERFELRVERNPQLGKVRGTATYVLDREGRLHLSGVATISLAGLTEFEAARRIEAEPNLRPLRATVLLLPLEPFGLKALEPFGYDLFEGAPVTFAPATDVPVPPEYIVGPGDQVRVQLFGQQNMTYRLVVNRDGSLNFPQIGPIVVSGLSFQQMRELLQQRVGDQMIGVSASVSMGELRSIRVFVLGDVQRPGSFTVSGLSSMTNALFVSGGIALSGSMRQVQLKRNGELVQQLDLYDLLLNGDNSGDARLMPNDVLFVPPRGATVAVSGEVQRPAIYELAGERSLAQVIRLAGGLMPTAYGGAVRLERIDPAAGRIVRTLDLESEQDRGIAVRGGDLVDVGPVLDVLTDHVTLAGHAQRPGAYQLRPGMRLTDLIGSVNHLRPNADRNYVLIRRQRDLSGPVEVFSADLGAALSMPGTAADPTLQNLDEVMVFDLGSNRVTALEPLLSQLRRQAVFGSPAREVAVAGMVRAPGTYPLEQDMRVSDLIRAGASLTDSAFALTAELTRYEVRDDTRRVVELIDVDLRAVLAGDPTADLLLQPFDFLNVKQISEWRRQSVVHLRGEVKFPGTYPFEPGERLSSVLARAGGPTEFAFLQGSVFLREDLRQRERDQIDRLIDRLEADLASMALQATRAAAMQGARTEPPLGTGQALLTQLRRAEPVGRLVIDLPAVLRGDRSHDVVLKDGDDLVIPARSQEVTVLGEVQHATSHVHDPRLRRDDYLRASGGLTANGDARRIYVVRANGAVMTGHGSGRWFRGTLDTEIRPGDTIVVPMDIDRVPALALWQSSTTILYNLAIAVAAIGSL